MTNLEKLQDKDNLRDFIVNNFGTFCPCVDIGDIDKFALKARCYKYETECHDCISAWLDEEVDDD